MSGAVTTRFERFAAGLAMAAIATALLAFTPQEPADGASEKPATAISERPGATDDEPARPIVTSMPTRRSASQDDAAVPSELHRGWLREVLDLDVGAAESLYRDVLTAQRPRNLQRWIAAARLMELQRIELTSGDRIDFTDAPPDLRPLFREADSTLEISQFDALRGQDTDTVFEVLGKPEAAPPPLRPLVAAAERWYEDQAMPSRLDRIRQRSTRTYRPPFTRRVFAGRVLRAEAADQRDRANELRSLYFPNWTPPPPAPEPQTDVARIRYNLGHLLQEREWTGIWRRDHRAFERRFEALAVTDPDAAVDLVRRIPLYAERLLRPTPNEKR